MIALRLKIFERSAENMHIVGEQYPAMDLYLALWILFWDAIIVSTSVTISYKIAKKSERSALAMRDQIQADVMKEVNALRDRIERITIPEFDTAAISDELKKDMGASLNAHITVVKKQINDLGEKIDTAIKQSGASNPCGSDILGDKIFAKLLEKF